MNYKEACQILDVPISASEDEIRKAFKNKAKEYHPDINKAPDALEKSKAASEAFNFLKEAQFVYKQEGFNWGTSWGDINFGGFSRKVQFDTEAFESIFSGFQSQFQVTDPKSNIKVNLNISFKEAILGADKEINITREERCDICTKESFKEEFCPNCNVDKQSFNPQYKKVDKKYTLKIPAGTVNNISMRLGGAGNYSYTRQKYGDVIVQLQIASDPKYRVDNFGNIFSSEKISLLQALKGDIVEWETVRGKQKVVIPPKTRHTDQIKLSGLGVPGRGYHIFTVEIEYPESSTLEKLVNVLEKE